MLWLKSILVWFASHLLWAFLVSAGALALGRIRKHFKAQQAKAEEVLTTFKVASSLASFLPRPEIAVLVQAHIQFLTRRVNQMILIFVVQVGTLLWTLHLPATVWNWMAIGVTATLTVWTGSNTFRASQSVEKLEDAFLQGFSEGVILNLRCTKNAVASSTIEQQKPAGSQPAGLQT